MHWEHRREPPSGRHVIRTNILTHKHSELKSLKKCYSPGPSLDLPSAGVISESVCATHPWPAVTNVFQDMGAIRLEVPCVAKRRFLWVAGPLSVGSVSTIRNYFSPTKSPYYTVGVAAGVALALECDGTSLGQWFIASHPGISRRHSYLRTLSRQHELAHRNRA